MKKKTKKIFLILAPIFVITAVATPLVITSIIKTQPKNDNNEKQLPRTIDENSNNNGSNDEDVKLKDFEYKEVSEINKNISIDKNTNKLTILLNSDELVFNKLNNESSLTDIENFVSNKENIRTIILNFIKDPKVEINFNVLKMYNSENNKDLKNIQYKTTLSAKGFNPKDFVIEFNIIEDTKVLDWKNADSDFEIENNILVLDLKKINTIKNNIYWDSNTLQENIIYQMNEQSSIDTLFRNKIENLKINDKLSATLTNKDFNSIEYNVSVTRNNKKIKDLKFKILHKNIFNINWNTSKVKALEIFKNKKDIITLDVSKYSGYYIDSKYQTQNDAWMGISKGLDQNSVIKVIGENNKTINGSNSFKKAIMGLLDINEQITEDNIKLELSSVDKLIIVRATFSKEQYFTKTMFLYIKNFSERNNNEISWGWTEDINYDFTTNTGIFDVRRASKELITGLPKNSIVNTVKIAMLSNKYNDQVLARIKGSLKNGHLIDSQSRLFIKLVKEERDSITFELIIKHPRYANTNLLFKMIALPNFGK